MEKFRIWFVFVLALLLTACSTSTTSDPSRSGPIEITLVATELQFDPAALEVIADQPVKLTLQNNGALEHDFTVLHIPLAGKPVSHEEEGEMAGHDMSGMSEQPELHVVAPAGKSNLLEFAPAEPGQYEFYCTVPGHKDAGMVGTLTVKAP